MPYFYLHLNFSVLYPMSPPSWLFGTRVQASWFPMTNMTLDLWRILVLQCSSRELPKVYKIDGEGHVMWAMHDTDGMLWLIKIPAYYIPKCKVRLLSMMSLLQMYKDEKIEINETMLALSGIPSKPTKGTVITWVNLMNNLPTLLSYHYGDTIQATDALTMVISTVDKANSNLTKPEKELICWHCLLGHIGFWKVQFLMRMGVLSQSQRNHKLHTVACKIIHPPKCALKMTWSLWQCWLNRVWLLMHNDAMSIVALLRMLWMLHNPSHHYPLCLHPQHHSCNQLHLLMWYQLWGSLCGGCIPLVMFWNQHCLGGSCPITLHHFLPLACWISRGRWCQWCQGSMLLQQVQWPLYLQCPYELMKLWYPMQYPSQNRLRYPNQWHLLPLQHLRLHHLYNVWDMCCNLHQKCKTCWQNHLNHFSVPTIPPVPTSTKKMALSHL